MTDPAMARADNSLTIEVHINDRQVAAQPDESVLAVLQRAGFHFTRRDATQAPRAALCGMGICQECAVTINGEPAQLACLRRCGVGMRIACDV